MSRLTWRPGSVHAVRAALLPAHSGPQRQVQHPAVGNGVGRTRLQIARHSGRHHFARSDQESRKARAASNSTTSGSATGVAGHARPSTLHRKAGDAIRRRASKLRQSKSDWVLRDVSFTVEPGETIAVVGHTGAGKTTLISLLLRFYDVQKGAIRIDGVDIRDMDLDDLRRRFGVVLQDPFLFSGTVAGNIRLGSEWIADEDVEKAAEEVNLADFIRSLPGGYGEEVRERGSTLSTGQKQLISFARALAHNPQILILDEATSSVDTETEIPGARCVEPHGGRPHVAGDRAPAVDRSSAPTRSSSCTKARSARWARTSNCSPSAASTTSSTSCSTRIRRCPTLPPERPKLPPTPTTRAA